MWYKHDILYTEVRYMTQLEIFEDDNTCVDEYCTECGSLLSIDILLKGERICNSCMQCIMDDAEPEDDISYNGD